MPEGQVLEFTHVTKRFNEVTAVSDFSARVEPGAVTAFLGPNGAGKTTTLRILLGQVRATSGTATIGGTAYAELRQPLRTIGAVLEETVYRPRRTAERQLTIAAKANGIPLARVGEVLSLVGLDGEGDSRIGGFSLGMRQRLSVAHALLGDPGALVFDEPANGLDPEGIRWMRLLMRRLADEGRTVLVSSHVLSEVEQVADNVLVLSKGRLVLASGIETLADPKGGSVIVDAADRGALRVALDAAGFDIEVLRSGLTVRGGDAGTVGAVAADAGIALSTLVQRGPTLEDVFIDLMRGGRLAPSADAAPPQLAATEPASDDAAPAPVDSVVAIPVAAAAAWAAEAAAAPAGDEVADDLAAAASVDGDAQDGVAELSAENTEVEDGAAEPTTDASASEGSTEHRVEEPSSEGTPIDEAPADEAPADETPIDETPTDETPTDETPTDETPTDEAPIDEAPIGEIPADEAPADDAPAIDALADESPVGADAPETVDALPGAEQDTDAQADEAPAEDTPVRSFDEILFGSAAPVAAASATTGETQHSVAQIFATADDAEADAPEQTAGADEASDDDAAAEDHTIAIDADTDDDAVDDEPAGVEIFADLDDTEATDTTASAPADTDADADADADANVGPEAEEADPRSAAVSSMLAAAARAYYEDEPKDYPLTAEADAAGDDSAGDDSAAEGAHWSIASTGVIDTVPLAESRRTDAEDSGDEPAAPEESDRDEHAEDSSGSDENDHEGEHHDGAHHDGEDHDGEDHDGEKHRD